MKQLDVKLMHPAEQITLIIGMIYRSGMTTTSGGNVSILDENGDIDPLFYYMQSLKEISLFYEGLDKALLIGGGGMAFPRYYTSCVPGGRMTVVEKDARMLDLARK